MCCAVLSYSRSVVVGRWCVACSSLIGTPSGERVGNFEDFGSLQGEISRSFEIGLYKNF